MQHYSVGGKETNFEREIFVCEILGRREFRTARFSDARFWDCEILGLRDFGTARFSDARFWDCEIFGREILGFEILVPYGLL